MGGPTIDGWSWIGVYPLCRLQKDPGPFSPPPPHISLLRGSVIKGSVPEVPTLIAIGAKLVEAQRFAEVRGWGS